MIVIKGKIIRPILAFRPIKYFFFKNWYGRRWNDKFMNETYYLFDVGVITFGISLRDANGHYEWIKILDFCKPEDAERLKKSWSWL